MAFIPIHDTNPLRHIRRPWVAWSLIAANVVIFFVFQSGGFGEASYGSVLSGGLIPAVFNGYVASPTPVPSVLTLVTYSFLHGSFWHLFGNMIFLWVLADNVEDAMGHVRFLVFYLLCAIAGGYAFVLTAPESTGPVVGASGAIAGTIAAYLILHPRAKMWVLAFGRIPLRLSAMYVLGFWVVFQVISVVVGGEDEVAWWSHLGGLVCGAALVLVLRRPGTPLFDRPAVLPMTYSPPPEAVDDSGAPPLGSPPTHDRQGPWK